MELLIVFLILGIICVGCLIDPFVSFLEVKASEKDLNKSLESLKELYQKSVLIITRRLGEGTSQNSDIVFADAHKNQAFAMNSIMCLMDQMGM